MSTRHRVNGACCQSMARAVRKARATSSMPPPGSSTTCASSVMVVARCRSLVSKTRFSLAQANRTGGGSSFYRRSRVNGTESSLTLCWREMDSNFRFRARGAIAIRPFALHLCPEGPERRRRPQSQGQVRPARESWQLFDRLQQEGVIPAGVKFQISRPPYRHSRS